MSTAGRRPALTPVATERLPAKTGGAGLTRDVDDASVDHYRRVIVTRAEARGEELLDLVVGAILDELPEYSRGRSLGDLSDIRGGVLRSIEFCLWAIGEGRGPTAEELQTMRLTGGQRARQGIPKPIVLASVKIGTRVGRAFLMTCGDMSDEPEALMAALRQLTSLLDRFEDDATVAMAEGYDEAYHRVLTGDDRGQAVLVDRLLESRFTDEDEILRHAGEVGLLPSREAYLVLVAPLVSASEKALRECAARLQPRMVMAAGPLRTTHVPHLALLVQPAGADLDDVVSLLDEAAKATSTVLVWHERPVRLTMVGALYRQVQSALPYLPAATCLPGTLPAVILRFHRAVFGGVHADRLELLDDLLEPFAELPEREAADLLETLDALYEPGGSATVLARHLHLHKNTVRNRFRRIREVTGLDLNRPKERLVLETMLRMRRLVHEELPVGDVSKWSTAATA